MQTHSGTEATVLPGTISTRRLRHLIVVAVAAALGAVLMGNVQPARAAEDNACLVSDVEYDVAASVVVRNTPFGAANGVYAMGSGKITLRIADQPGHEAVKLMSYELVNRLTVDAKVAMLSTRVVTASRTSTARDACEGSAQGTLRDGTLTWDSKVTGYRSDGTMECSGSMCGKFGAPPEGTSPFHDAPAAIRFSPFTFSADGSTFTMPYTLVSSSDSPRQTTYLGLSGRRVKRFCAAPHSTACSS
jgi:hypothetical protein